MKVLLYSYEYPPLGGGVANALKHILPELSKQENLEIDFVTSALDNKFAKYELFPRITVHKLPIGKKSQHNLHKQSAKDMIIFTFMAYFYTWKLILAKKYDFNHFFGFPGGIVSLLFRWRMRYIISLRGIEVPGYSPKFGNWYKIYRPFAWLSWKFADAVITNSQALGELAQKTMPNLKFGVITNGVDVEAIKPKTEDDKFPEFTVTAGGTILGKIKGLDYLMTGFAKLHKEFPDTKLKLIGSGDARPELEDLAMKFSIQDAVEFLGRQPHEWIEQNLGKFHMLCLPSLNEGMSNAMLEGLSAGLPLVITETGGTKEILDENKNGMIVPQQDSESIYLALRKLYLDPELRIKMGKASRAKAEQMSWQQVGQDYYNLYKDTVKQ